MSPRDVRLMAMGLLLGGGLAACGTPPPDAEASPTPAASSNPPAAAAAYPLRADGASRRLVDAQGRPFFVVGDAAWSLVSGLTRDDASRYLADRRARGFNTV